MSRLELASIPSLTLYKDSVTTARRTSPLPQLVCRGAPCKLYTPEVVRCVNLGGSGTDVDWKCEADLPDSLRFGKVEVSCEGWSRPGDQYVLKGSCSLEYRLVHVPGALRDDHSPLSGLKSYDLSAIIFWIAWFAFSVFILYNIFLSCFRQPNTSRRMSPPGPRPGSSGGWFPGSLDNDQAPPPPYMKNPPEPANQGWRPGFWTGAALGGLANHVFNRRREEEPRPRPATWDWERPRASVFSGNRGATPVSSDDRGEGTSNLGTMRRSTGFGGSSSR